MRRAEKVRRDQIHRFPNRIYGHMAELAQEPEREYPVIFVEVERRCHSVEPGERLVFPALRIVPLRRQRITALALVGHRSRVASVRISCHPDPGRHRRIRG